MVLNRQHLLSGSGVERAHQALRIGAVAISQTFGHRRADDHGVVDYGGRRVQADFAVFERNRCVLADYDTFLQDPPLPFLPKEGIGCPVFAFSSISRYPMVTNTMRSSPCRPSSKIARVRIAGVARLLRGGLRPCDKPTALRRSWRRARRRLAASRPSCRGRP